MNRLLVIIMPISRENNHMHHSLCNLVYQTVFLRDSSTPQCTLSSFKRLRFASTRLGMVIKLGYQGKSLLINFWFTLEKLFQVILGLLLNLYNVSAHKLRMNWSSSSTLENCLPGCFLASLIRVINSSCVKADSSRFSLTSLRKYLATRSISFSSSAIILILRRISAFICMEVIFIILHFATKLNINSETIKNIKIK